MNPHQYKVPPFTVGELATLILSAKDTVCRWYAWRHTDPVWPKYIREAIAAIRKLQAQEVV
jgi:hypothetical protein